MTLYQILTLFGVSAFFSGIVGIIVKRLETKLKKNTDDTKAVKLGVQALLRAQMINDYNKWSDKGYAPIYARENFENVWDQYHELGANGVMDDIHEKFLDLPTSLHKKKGGIGQ